MTRAMYKEWLDKDKLVLLQGWKHDGLTNTEIAHDMGVSISTLNKWKREHIQIGQTLKRGRDGIDIIVENALLKKVLSDNTTAMIFFLKSNWRGKYNDSQLSKKEHELVLADIKRANVDVRIKKAKAIAVERLGTKDDEQLDQVLNKLIEEVRKVGTDKSINEGTD